MCLFFQRMDVNKDGVISVEEFMDTCRKVCKKQYITIIALSYLNSQITLSAFPYVQLWIYNEYNIV